MRNRKDTLKWRSKIRRLRSSKRFWPRLVVFCIILIGISASTYYWFNYVNYSKQVIEMKAVPYTTVTELDDSLPDATEVVTQEGKNGERRVTYLVTYVHGKQAKKEVQLSTVTQKPVTKIVKKKSQTVTDSLRNPTSGMGKFNLHSPPTDFPRVVRCKDGKYAISRPDTPTCEKHGGVDETY